MKETDFARYLTQFLTVYLPGHLGSKKNTQLSYRDSFSLLPFFFQLSDGRSSAIYRAMPESAEHSDEKS